MSGGRAQRTRLERVGWGIALAIWSAGCGPMFVSMGEGETEGGEGWSFPAADATTSEDPDFVCAGQFSQTGSFNIEKPSDFRALKGVVEITGDLRIGESIDSVAQLEALRCINGSLLIVGNPLLRDLDGLSRLQHIGRDAYIGNNAQLESLDGLESLRVVGLEMSLYDNPVLRSLDGLSSLTHVGTHLAIVNSDQLTSLEGLASLEALSYLSVARTGLVDMRGLAGLAKVHGGIFLSDNPKLRTLTGLDSVGVLPFHTLSIVRNPVLEDLDGLETITKLGTLQLRDNPSLTSLRGLSQLRHVMDQFVVSGNAALEDLDGLEAIEGVGSVQINYSPALRTIDALSSLSSVAQVQIIHNDALEHLDGLAGLSTILYNLEIASNASLSSIDGLASLTSIGTNLHVGRNPVLPQCRVDEWVATLEIGGEVILHENLDEPSVCDP